MTRFWGVLAALLVSSAAWGQSATRPCFYNASGQCVFISASNPLPVSATITPGGTQDVNLIQVGGATVAIGQAAMAASLPVAIASNQSAITVTGAGGTFPATQSTSPWIVAGGGTAGTAATGVVTVQGIASMTKLLVTPDLPSGASTAANQTAVQTPVAAGAATATKGVLLGGQFDTTQKTLTDGQQAALSVSSRGAAFVAVGADGFAVTNAGTFAVQSQPTPVTSGGLSVYNIQPAASDNHAVIKAGAGQIYKIEAFNNSATVNYVRFYNATTGFNGCNSSTNLVWQGIIPASTSGAGLASSWEGGMAFATGISICVTSGYAQNDTTNATASALVVNVGYK